MRLARWILLLPGAVLVGMIGSLVGGIVATPFGQAAMNTSSAFFGIFAFVCAAGVIAPSHRSKVALIATLIVSLLALVRFALSMFTTVEEFTGLSTWEKVLIPTAQFLGSLYALFVLPPLMLQGSTLDRLWREITTLGTIVGLFGVLVVLIGLVLGLLGRGWVSLSVGLGVLLLGVLTWLFPYVHLILRVDKAEALIEQHIEELANRQEFRTATREGVKDITPEIGREISWADIVRHVFRVLEFDRAGTTIGPSNQIKASSAFSPYGYLLVESPIVNQPTRLPIIHRDDFWLAASVFDEPSLVDLVTQEELLVTYAPKKVLPGGLSGEPSHVLHYVIAPSGTLERYYSKDNDLHMAEPEPELLMGSFVYEGEIRVHVNLEPKS